MIGSFIFNAGGNVFAQFLAVVFIPILSRMYSPEEFGIATFFLAITSCAISVSSLRYATAIPIVKGEKEFLASIVSSSAIVAATSVLFWWVIYNFNFEFLRPIFEVKDIAVIYIIVMSINNILINVIIRRGEYKTIGLAKISSATILNFSRLLAGLLSIENGLVVSLIISELVTLFVILYSNKPASFLIIRERTLKKNNILDFLKKYKRYPIFQVPSQASLIVTQYAPVFLLSISFDASYVGIYAMANNLVNMPVNSFGLALSQIFYGEFSKEHNQEKMLKTSLIIIGSIVTVTIPVLLIFYLYGESIIALLLGNRWQFVYEVSFYMLILGATKLCVSSISQSFNIFDKQSFQLKLNILSLFSSYSSLFLSMKIGVDFLETIYIYSICSSIANVITVILILRMIKRCTKN
ncbi:TPA: lipopolysaccharide biosynthesis protein [Vibrio vulnificus]